MSEQSVNQNPEERSAMQEQAERLNDEQLEAVSGGNHTNASGRLSHLETRTVVQSDKGPEPGQNEEALPNGG